MIGLLIGRDRSSNQRNRFTFERQPRRKIVHTNRASSCAPRAEIKG